MSTMRRTGGKCTLMRGYSTSRARAQPAGDLEGAVEGRRRVAADDDAESAPTFGEEPVEPAYVPTIERVRVPRRPPLIEIPDDLEVDVSDFVGIDRRRGAVPEFTLEPEPAVDAEPDGVANEEAA